MNGKVFFEVANGTPYGSYGGQGFFNPDFFSLSGDSEIGGTNSGNADASLSESIRKFIFVLILFPRFSLIFSEDIFLIYSWLNQSALL